MDKLSIFNNEELLEVYAKVEEEINHLNENIIVEEEPELPKEEVQEEPSEENNSEEEKEEKEEESDEQS